MGTPQFFEIPELVLEVLDLCNIAQLTALSTTCRHMAAMGERSMQGRVRRGLRKLLQDDGEPADTARITTDKPQPFWRSTLFDASETMVE